MTTYTICYIGRNGLLYQWSTIAADKQEAIRKFRQRKGAKLKITYIYIVKGSKK